MPISIKKPAPAGSSLGPIRMTNLPVFVGLTPSEGRPTDPGATSNCVIAIGGMSLEGAASGPAGMAN